MGRAGELSGNVIGIITAASFISLMGLLLFEILPGLHTAS